jgi:hypothetical protein
MDMNSLTRSGKAALIGGRNLIVGANLASLRWLTKPRQLLGYVNETLFLLRTYNGVRELEQRNVFDVLPADATQTVQLGALDRRGGVYGEPWFHAVASYSVDIVSLCLLCRITKPRTVFEIGTLRGYTAYHLALNTDPDTRVFTLDLPGDQSVSPALKTTLVDCALLPAEPRDYCFAGAGVAGKITTLVGDSATFDYEPFLGRVDLFYIDGAHSYEYVRSDTENALRCCHSGSIIAWHDYGRVGVNGVSRWLHELARTHKVYSVPGGSLAYMIVGGGAA